MENKETGELEHQLLKKRCPHDPSYHQNRR